MTPWLRRTCCIFLTLTITAIIASASSKEFLTPKEIEKIQDAQEISERVKIYLEAATLRLKTAAERLAGKESVPGDPLEFFSVEEMIDGYYRILRAVMMNLDGASQNPSTDASKMQGALKNLKSATEQAARPLEVLKKTAEERRREELWNLINKAIEINKGAREGAAAAIKKQSDCR